VGVTAVLASRPFRRLLVTVVVLAALDPFVPSFVRRLERRQYESDRLFRFENSDLFTLGPLSSYLRENPHGERPRIVFLGDSIIWGYYVRPSETIPAQYQRLDPSLRVLNFGINGFGTSSAYLIAKSVIDAVDVLYVLDSSNGPRPDIPRIIPIAPEDVERFNLTMPDPTERALERPVLAWNLYRDAYRLQSALFGTSTRLYLYLHKADLLHRLRGDARSDTSPASIEGTGEAVRKVSFSDEAAPSPPSDRRAMELKGKWGLLWDFATLVQRHHKRAVFILVDRHSSEISDEDRADLNAVFAPDVKFVKVALPDELRVDEVHFSPLGCAAVARLLAQALPPGDARPSISLGAPRADVEGRP
jgi:hypothetical protein